MRALLEQAARECVLGDRPVRLKVCVEPGDLQTTGDPERLHQVVANLLDNAVRHSPPEGRVWLSAHAATAGRTTIVVADEGPGIPPEEAERVFERFHRTDAARATRDGGTGLGLAIARWIVDAHGGAIRAEAREPQRLPDGRGAAHVTAGTPHADRARRHRRDRRCPARGPARRASASLGRRDRAARRRRRVPRGATPGPSPGGCCAAALAAVATLRAAGWVVWPSLVASPPRSARSAAAGGAALVARSRPGSAALGADRPWCSSSLPARGATARDCGSR